MNNLITGRQSHTGGGSVDLASVSGPPSRPLTPMLDPSMNTNVLTNHGHDGRDQERLQGTQHNQRSADPRNSKLRARATSKLPASSESRLVNAA